MPEKMKKVTIYTDGACSKNPGKGGWGALLIYGKHQKEICGGEAATTNNRMELTAVINALKILKEPCNIEIYTDSLYVMDGVTKWLPNWQKNQWRTSQKKPVKNSDLWQELAAEIARHTVNWNWVKGHSGDIGNETADMLANKGMKEATRHE